MDTIKVVDKLQMLEDQVMTTLSGLVAEHGDHLCSHGSIVLVDTGQPLADWCGPYLAQRPCPWVVWKVDKALI